MDAAYINLLPPERRVPGMAQDSVELTSLDEAGELTALHSLVLDFDREGRLIGIEVLQAQDVLPAAVLDAATVVG